MAGKFCVALVEVRRERREEAEECRELAEEAVSVNFFFFFLEVIGSFITCKIVV